MHPGSRVLWECSVPPAILPRSPKLCQNGGNSVLSSIAETGKRRCVVVMQQTVLLSPKFGAKSSHIFTQSPYSVTVVCGIDCLAYHQDELFVNNPLDVIEKDGLALDFALHLFRPFRSRWVWTFRVRIMLSFPYACIIIASVSVALFPRFAQ
jgi:hypothetical protein